MTAFGRTRAIFERFPYSIEPNIVGVEVGVNIGQMSEDLLKRPNLFLYMVDNWKAEADQPEHYRKIGDYHAHLSAQDQASRKDQAEARTEFAKERRMILHTDSAKAATNFGRSFDFVFIDGDHSYEGCTIDIEMWKGTIRPNGYLCGHDYDREGVKRAVDDAVERYHWNLELDQDNTWFCKM